MNKKTMERYIAVPKSFFVLTGVGMAVSFFSGVCISEVGLSFSQYFMHYGAMFVGAVCFVKAINSIHVYEKKMSEKV